MNKIQLALNKCLKIEKYTQKKCGPKSAILYKLAT